MEEDKKNTQTVLFFLLLDDLNENNGQARINSLQANFNAIEAQIGKKIIGGPSKAKYQQQRLLQLD